jgi:hypothetical protein
MEWILRENSSLKMGKACKTQQKNWINGRSNGKLMEI